MFMKSHILMSTQSTRLTSCGSTRYSLEEIPEPQQTNTYTLLNHYDFALNVLTVAFELQATNAKGDHFILTKKYNKSLHPQSNLRKDLQQWRGAPFDEEDLRRGFDLSKVVSKSCILYLEDRDGYIAIESILPTEDGILYKPSGEYTRAVDR